MSSPRADEVTLLLSQLSQGRSGAEAELLPLVYEELRGLARHYMQRERDDHTLQPTALVHEAWIRLAGQREVTWQSRGHFLGIAAQAMRRILVDHARRSRADKRDSGRKTAFDELGVPGELVDLLALDRALEALGAFDPRILRVVELRYFAGLSVAEVAGILGVSEVTVKRDWRDARAWLRRALADDTPAEDASAEEGAP